MRSASTVAVIGSKQMTSCWAARRPARTGSRPSKRTRRPPSLTAKRAGALDGEQVVEGALAEREALGRHRLATRRSAARARRARGGSRAGSSTSHARAGRPEARGRGESRSSAAPAVAARVHGDRDVERAAAVRGPRRSTRWGNGNTASSSGLRRPVQPGREPRGVRRGPEAGRRPTARRAASAPWIGRPCSSARTARGAIQRRPRARRPRSSQPPSRLAHGYSSGIPNVSPRLDVGAEPAADARAARRRGGAASSRPSPRRRRSAPRASPPGEVSVAMRRSGERDRGRWPWPDCPAGVRRGTARVTCRGPG